MQWNAEADQEILMVILEKCEVKIPYEDIAHALGCTPKAVTHRISKIKKTVQEKRQYGGAASANANNNNNDNSDEAPVTPAKRKRTVKKEPKTPKSSKKVKVEDEDEIEDDDDAGLEI